MHRIAIACALFFVDCASTPPSTPLDKTAMARRLAELGNSPEYWNTYAEAIVEEAMNRLPDFSDICETAVDIDGCEAFGKKVTSEIKTALDASAARIESFRPSLIEDEARANAEIYTSEELKVMLDLYDSPLGQSMHAKAPAMTKLMARLQYDRLRPWSSEMNSVYELIYQRRIPELEPFFTESTEDN